MNWAHRRLCRSAGWKKTVEDQIVPWVLKDVQLGANVLEVGPGPGMTTEVLRTRVERLTCIEIDTALAASLKERMNGSNVTVLCDDATHMSVPDRTFDSAVCFTMLHHVPSAALQDRLLAEVARVLQPGAIFAGTDSRYSVAFGILHWFDTMVVVDPETFPKRLEAAGFRNPEVELNPRAFRFRAWRA